jgi:DNA-binding winged helix-turn-helix (wHTH) protein/TolB-like protein/Flp pilus assembly protein TadD
MLNSDLVIAGAGASATPIAKSSRASRPDAALTTWNAIMSSPDRFAFGGFILERSQQRVLQSDGRPVNLTPRLFSALLLFVERSGELLDKESMMAALWPGLVVEENNLNQVVHALRRVLGDEAGPFIETVPRRGFRFVAAVTALSADENCPPPRETFGAEASQLTRYLAASLSSASANAFPAAASTWDGRRGSLPGAMSSTPAFSSRNVLLDSIEGSPRNSRERRILLFGATATCALATLGLWRLWPSLREVGVVPPGPIAVLPFNALTSGSGDDSLALGVAESLSARLSSVRGFVVRTMPLDFEGRTFMHDPLLASRELGADWLIDGGLHVSNDELRISARLLRSGDATVTWHGSFSGKLPDIFAIEDRIANELVAQLRPVAQLDATPKEFAWREAGATRRLDAYRLYLAALWRVRWNLPDDVDEAVVLLNQAVKIDPDYALAWILMAKSHRQRLFNEQAEPGNAFGSERTALDRALLLAPNLSTVRIENAYRQWWYEFDWERAANEFRAALAANPNNAEAHVGLGMLMLSTQGRVEEGLQYVRVACELDPTYPGLRLLEAHYLIEAGRVEEGHARADTLLRSFPRWWRVHATIALAHFARAQEEAGLSSLRTAVRLAKTFSRPSAQLGFHLARLGRKQEARTVLAELLAMARIRYVPPTAIAAVQSGVGDIEGALSSLELAAAVRDYHIVSASNDPHWRALRNEPRFSGLIRRMNLDLNKNGLALM